MKNNKISIKTVMIVILIVTIISIFFIILNIKNKNIERQEVVKEQLGELVTNNAYITLEAHNLELDEKQQEINNIQNTLGQAVYNQGIILYGSTGAIKSKTIGTYTVENTGEYKIYAIVSSSAYEEGNINILKGGTTIFSTGNTSKNVIIKEYQISLNTGDILTFDLTRTGTSNAATSGSILIFRK